MYYKIENENFWKKVCKRLDDIFLVLESLINIVERFVIQNFEKVSTFNKSNCIIKYNRIFLICSEEKIFTMNFPFKILEGTFKPASTSFGGINVFVNATARTKRETGVASPGSPSIPLPAPKGARLTPSISLSGGFPNALSCG